ncbi:MAG: FtsQ-type POTRA domain-containing protein [Bacteroidota bacterium]
MESSGNTTKKSTLRGALFTALLVLVGLAAGIGANLWKENLHVTQVRVEGNRIVPDREILRLAAVPGDERLFAIDLYAVRRRVEQNTFIRTAAVTREAPDGIAIAVEERTPIAAIGLPQLMYLDAEGTVLPPSRSEALVDLPVLTGDLSAEALVPGRKITRNDVREAIDILATAKLVGDDLYHLISEIHCESGKDLLLYTAEAGVSVVFGHGDVAMKLVKLDGFWREVVAQRGAGDLRAVDLRFEDQVVVRWNERNTEAP